MGISGKGKKKKIRGIGLLGKNSGKMRIGCVGRLVGKKIKECGGGTIGGAGERVGRGQGYVSVGKLPAKIGSTGHTREKGEEVGSEPLEKRHGDWENKIGCLCLQS